MPGFLADLNPGWLLIFAGLAALFIRMRIVRQAITVAVPLIAILMLATRSRRRSMSPPACSAWTSPSTASTV